MADDVGAALAQWLGNVAAVQVTGRATVGLSQETWFLDIDGRDAVLRLPTPASGTRAIRTQRAALQAVAGQLPAPAVLWCDDGDDNPFGRPFLVMERVHGEVPVGWHVVPEPERTGLAEQAVDILADLRRVPAGELAQATAGPSMLEFYTRRLPRFEPLPAVVDGAVWWLERHRPSSSDEGALVHGDLRMGNLVVADGRIRGILDWEMAGPGDPLADLAWCFIPLWDPPGVDEPALLRRYGERIGTPVDPVCFHWHRVLGYLRLAYYALSGTWAFDQRRSDDLRHAALRLQLPVHLDRLAATLAGEPVT